MGGLEAAAPARDGAGEGAPLVAEELALDERVDERGRVDRDERAVAPVAPGVEGPGGELLARAALAREEDARLAPGGAGEEGADPARSRASPRGAPRRRSRPRGACVPLPARRGASRARARSPRRRRGRRGAGGRPRGAGRRSRRDRGRPGAPRPRRIGTAAAWCPSRRSATASRRSSASAAAPGGPAGEPELPREAATSRRPFPSSATRTAPAVPPTASRAEDEERLREPLLGPLRGEPPARGEEEPEAPLRPSGRPTPPRLRRRAPARPGARIVETTSGSGSSSAPSSPASAGSGRKTRTLDPSSIRSPAARRWSAVERPLTLRPLRLPRSRIRHPSGVRARSRVTPGEGGVGKADPARGVAAQHDLLRLEGDLRRPGTVPRRSRAGEASAPSTVPRRSMLVRSFGGGTVSFATSPDDPPAGGPGSVAAPAARVTSRHSRRRRPPRMKKPLASRSSRFSRSSSPPRPPRPTASAWTSASTAASWAPTDGDGNTLHRRARRPASTSSGSSGPRPGRRTTATPTTSAASARSTSTTSRSRSPGCSTSSSSPRSGSTSSAGAPTAA